MIVRVRRGKMAGLTMVVVVASWGAAAWAQDTGARIVPTRAGVPTVPDDAMLGRTVALKLERVRLADALTELAERSGVRVVYSAAHVPVDKIVSLVAEKITVRNALSVLLEDTGLDAVPWTLGRVRLEPSGEATARKVARGRQQGGGTIGGRVTDAMTKAPLDQVAVRVEGSGAGAVTASDGRYVIRNVPPGTYHLAARRVGYMPLTRAITTTADSVAIADFALAPAPNRLNEVVTTAVGDQRRYEVGNVISTINADSITPTAPITSLTDLISARAPGVTVEEMGGLVGSGGAVRIRGQSSLVLQSDPIVIVDGVREDNAPGGAYSSVGAFSAGAVPAPSRLNDLNFNDIQSIDVLKGPAASTEYGTDAANGVIVITTKHGTADRPRWTASAEETASEIPESFPTLYHSWGHTTAPSHAPVGCPLTPSFSGYGVSARTCAVDSVTMWDPLNSSHYSVFGTGSRRKYDLAVGGGSDAVRYYVSGHLSKETGVLRMPGAFMQQAAAIGLPHSLLDPNGEDQRSVRANTAIRLGPTADLTVTGAYLSTYQRTPNAQLLFFGLAPLRDSAINYGYGFGLFSPVYQFGNPNDQTADRLTGGVTANWQPTPWFVGHGTLGVDHGSLRNTAAIVPQIGSLNPFTAAQLAIENATKDLYTVDLRGSATAVLTRTTRAITSIGLQLADTRTQGTTATATGITATNYTLNGAVNPAVSQLGNRQATLGGYGEEELALSDRLFLTGAVRVDAGSGFGHAYSTAVYPKASASWLALNTGSTTARLRAAFGESGVQPPNGTALRLYAPGTVWYGGGFTSAVGIVNIENPGLQPERSQEYEGGLDATFWDNRLSLELTGYSKTTQNALVTVGTGWEAGSYPHTENVGEVRNTGAEGALTASVVRAGPVTWQISLNASVNHNRLLTLAPGLRRQQTSGETAIFRFTPGYPLYGYWAPRVQYGDLNHDGMVEPNEVTVADSLSYVGSSLPAREVSVGTHIGLWRGTVNVGALFDYRGGFRLMNATAYEEVVNRQSDRASNDRTAPLSQQARDVGQQVIELNGLDGYAPAAPFYEDATYVRFRELSLTYTLPRKAVRALRFQSLSLTGAVRNLALWTRYSGVDPEVTNSIGANAQLSPTSNTYIVNHDIREDLGSVPLLRYWVVRLSLGL